MKKQYDKEWLLFLFRNYQNNHCDDIEKAKFKFGRTRDEVLEIGGQIMPTALISIIKSKILQDVAMETGLAIIFTTINPKNNDYFPLYRLLSSPPTFHENGYALYSYGDNCYPLRFVDIYRVNDNAAMPDKIWIKLRPLSLNEISWGIENNLFENIDENKLKGEQLCLSNFGFDMEKPKENKELGISYVPKLPFPGPSNFNYKF